MFFEIFMIGFGLSMDAVAVSMTNGMVFKGCNAKRASIIALSFGLFQGIMPLIGFLGGSFFADAIAAYDHWIALILLSIIGGKMILDSIQSDKDEDSGEKIFTFKLLLLQSIATSIDALAIGVSFAAMNINIFGAVSIIAVTTFILSFFAVYVGKNFGTLLNKKAEILGGLVLIGIGIKIFIEHVFL